MTPRSPRFTVALVLSAAIHIGLLAAIAFLPRQKPPPEEEPPEVVVLELAALGEPEAPEPEPEQTPVPEPEPEPAPPPQPELEPEPEPEPEPVEVEPEPEPELEPEPEPPPPDITARPEPKPEPPKPPEPVTPPPVVTPQPAPQPPPVPEKPAPPAVKPPEQAAKPPPKKGIKEGVAGAVSQEAMNRYVTTLFTMIDRRKVYPSQSLRRREEGTVIVRLKIAADGALLDVTSPTGEPERLVDASLNAVRRAAPFPPLPESFTSEAAEFQVPVVYKLQ